MSLTKKEVQQRVLQNGSPLALDKFNWDQKTKTFSSLESGLVIDFNYQLDCTFDTGSYCTFKTGSGCTFDTGSGCTFDTESGCTFKTESYCTFKTESDCTFKTGSDCTFDTESDCTFKTGSDCTFDTGSYCTFKTESYCTFDTESGCTFDTGWDCVIVRRDIFQVIQPNAGDIVQLCPYKLNGYLVNGMYNGKPHIIVDGILSKIVSQRGNVFRVINHGETKQSYLVKSGDTYSHGATLRKARESLIYKISDRDTGKYEGMKLDSVVKFAEAVAMYRTITGACAKGCQYFVEQNKDKKKDEYTIAELIELTKGQYNSDMFVKFFTKGQNHA